MCILDIDLFLEKEIEQVEILNERSKSWLTEQMLVGVNQMMDEGEEEDGREEAG